MTTVAQDATRAHLHLHDSTVPHAHRALAQALDEHLAAGRRFLRLDVSAADSLDPDSIELLVRTHHALLKRRGTLILTGAGDGVVRALRDASCAHELFVLGRFADSPDHAVRLPW